MGPEVFQAPQAVVWAQPARRGPAQGTLTTLVPLHAQQPPKPRAPQASPPQLPQLNLSSSIWPSTASTGPVPCLGSALSRTPAPSLCHWQTSSGITPQRVLGGPQRAATGPPSLTTASLRSVPAPREAFLEPPRVTSRPYWKLLEGSCSQGLGPQHSLLFRQWCADCRQLIIKFLGIL